MIVVLLPPPPNRFNIINLLKEDSTYNMRMLPLMHSERNMRTTVRVHMCMCMATCTFGARAGLCVKAAVPLTQFVNHAQTLTAC
jgi:hypothetical protein